MIAPFQTPMGESGAQIAYAVNFAAGYYSVAPDHIAVDYKRGRLLIHDRPADQDGAQVVTVLRASRTGSSLWFEVDGDRPVAMHDLPGDQS